MRHYNHYIAISCLFIAGISTAQAEKLFSDSSISLLHSDQYEAFGREQQEHTFFTFENVTAHDWGGTFFFIDANQGHGSASGQDDVYGEFSPTLSLNWLTGQDFSAGPLQDISLAATYEFGGETDLNNYLTGFSLSWDVPGFQYVNTAFYHANNSQIDNDLQLTLTWGAPFELGAARFLFDGFLDYSTAESDHKSELNFTPQLKLDIGNFSGNPGVLYAGIEYAYWRNKYGLSDDVMDTESSVSALIKFHF
ncbi:outer membrane protein OmpK [Halomonas sp.]|uniref:outer membrane protein OmpK n=1 Tax=Halomonas sp. TaxID=1486246 RepID=UPI00298D7DD1|nr:outer membrane protein OmpK [Halomonas sp.]MDW7745624.1 outer membrane protein OmpK [Halomonas sp.]